MIIQRAAVTGGAGFIGSHIVDTLVEQGVEVLVIDNLATGSPDNLSAARAAAGRLEFVEADIRSSEAAQALIEWKPQWVFHLAAQINVRRSVDEPQYDAEANVVGTVNILEAAVKAKSERLIFTSTGGAIYGEQDRFPAGEDHPIRPKCPYGVSKRAGEQYLEYYGRCTPLTTIALRLANVYGPRQNPKGEAGVVAIFTDRLLRGENLVVNGEGTQTRDFVYVGDVVQAAILAAERDGLEEFSVFNVGRGIEISVNDVVEALQAVWAGAAGSGRGELHVVHGPALKGEQMRSVIAPDMIRSELQWEPRTNFTEGLAETVKSFLRS